MSMTDPVADMLTRVRNACAAGHKRVAEAALVAARGLVYGLLADDDANDIRIEAALLKLQGNDKAAVTKGALEILQKAGKIDRFEE